MSEVAIRPNGGSLVAATHSAAEYVPTRSLMEWAQEADAAFQLAVKLCTTPFCPDTFRDKPGDAAAAIMAGSEVGLSPLAALNAYDVIQGRPAPKAITLRALVLSAGHDIYLVSSTPQQAVYRGRRRGSEHVQESVWDIERARAMDLLNKPNWRKQPQAMLVARATSECARLVAPDVLLGVPYSAEEVADFDLAPSSVKAEPVTAAPPKPRTARRAPVAVVPPEPEFDEPTPAVAESEPAAPTLITDAQMKKLHASLKDHGMTDRALALAFMGDQLGRDVDSSKTLTKDEASRVIDALEKEPVEATLDAGWPEPTEVPA